MKYAIEMTVSTYGGLHEFCDYFSNFDKDGCVVYSKRIDMHKPRLWKKRESAEKWIDKILKCSYITKAEVVEVEE